MKKITGLFFAFVIASGQSVAAIKSMPISFDAPSAANLKKLQKTALAEDAMCSFTVADISDQRQNKQTIGFSLNASGVDSWLGDATKAYMANTVRPNATIQVQALPRLIRLYTYPESMNILGVSALVVDYVVDGKVVRSRQYRGFTAKTNWANGDGEYLTALNESLNDLMPKWHADLKSQCDSISQL
jgi:hypothetical protein